MGDLSCYHRLCIRLYLYLALNFRLSNCKIIVVVKLYFEKSQKCLAYVTCVLLINFILKSRLIWKMLCINFYVVSGIAGEFCSAIISDYPMKKFNDVM